MNGLVFRLSFRFIAVLLFQILVLNNIQLTGLMNPYFYPLFVILLPLEVPMWASLIIGFFTGLCVGSFTNAAGLHAFATVLIVALRPIVLSALLPKASLEGVDEPTIRNIGPATFITLTVILVFVHHFTFFILEVMSFTLFYFTIIKVLTSTIVSSVIIILSQYLVGRWR